MTTAAQASHQGNEGDDETDGDDHYGHRLDDSLQVNAVHLGGGQDVKDVCLEQLGVEAQEEAERGDAHTEKLKRLGGVGGGGGGGGGGERERERERERY